MTGSAKGIGAGVAQNLASAGAAVVLADIQYDECRQRAASLRSAGWKADSIELDVTNDHQWEHAIAFTIRTFGRFDILVNNAGVLDIGLLIDLDPDDAGRMIKVNVVGTALGIKHAFRAMRPGGIAGSGGAIVNISSVSALSAIPGSGVYAATKSAIDRLTRVAAVEAGQFDYGVRVNCIFPGSVATEMGTQVAEGMVRLGLVPNVHAAEERLRQMTPLKRPGKISEIAEAVLFLASDQASYITGTGLPVAGGRGI